MAQVICKTDDVPEGKGKTFEIDGKKVAVFKVEGNFYAVNDTCIHKGGPLGEGYLNDTVVTCPWHGWQFDVASGKRKGIPWQRKTSTGTRPSTDGFSKRTASLLTFSTARHQFQD